MPTDSDLLQSYIDDGTEEAFSAIVARHLNLVYSVANRLVKCPHLAQDVTQSVFCDIARSARKLRSIPSLTSWIYQVTRRTAIDLLRKEYRRTMREQAFVELEIMRESTSALQNVEAGLEDAMHSLPASDRALILARFFENRSLRDTGRLFSISEDTAQKRVTRALERLREFYRKRGFSISVAGLATTLSANAVQTAPATLLPALTTVLPSFTIATTAVSPIFVWLHTGLFTMNTLQKAVLITSIGLGMTWSVIQLTLRQTAPPLVELSASKESLLSKGTKVQTEPAKEYQTISHEQNELARINGQLEQELQNVKKEKYLAEQSKVFANLLANKLAGKDQLQLPKTLNEAALRSGRLHKKLLGFSSKWSDKPPLPGSGEWSQYEKEADILTSELAACIEFGDSKQSAPIEPANISRFYATTLAGALDLNEGQTRTLTDLLERKYEEGFKRKLDRASRPKVGIETWEQQRAGLSRQAYSEIQANLTPSQRSEFQRLYADDFMWKFFIGAR